MRCSLFSIFICLLFSAPAFAVPAADSVYFTTGLKAGEVTDHSVVILTRLCASPKARPVTHLRKDPPFRSPLDFNEDMAVANMDGFVAGTSGEVRIMLSRNDDSITSGWMTATADHDYIVKKSFDQLSPYTRYQIIIEGRKNNTAPVTSFTGSFSTAPPAGMIVPVSLTSSSCQYFWDFDDPVRGFKIYDSMFRLYPDFYVQTGDYVYYDKPGPIAGSLAKARYKWNAMNAWPALVRFSAQVPFYVEKDDHDMLRDDAYPGIDPLDSLTFEQALAVWYNHVPVGEIPYRTFRWGKDLQIWLVEGREYRSPNTMPDGPDKTIWGEKQKAWLEKTMRASDATFKLLFSQTPIVGPDREKGKRDNYANKAFETEGNWVRKFLSSIPNLYVINGDRHWQYVSVDDQTGLTEFSQGPASDSHAQGWKPEDIRPEHRFLRVKGGFVGVKVDRTDEGKPFITFTHYDVDGKIVHEERFEP